jgi:hypothetical protein
MGDEMPERRSTGIRVVAAAHAPASMDEDWLAGLLDASAPTIGPIRLMI